jgi:sugar phosphate isomerase/epimerase
MMQMANEGARYDGGYLPIKDFVRAVMETGFAGWLSIEVFDGRFEEKHGDDLRQFAKQAMEACKRLMVEANAR